MPLEGDISKLSNGLILILSFDESIPEKRAKSRLAGPVLARKIALGDAGICRVDAQKLCIDSIYVHCKCDMGLPFSN